MNIRKLEHYVSRLTPNLHPLNAILIAREFYRRFGRLPRRPSNPTFDYHDFLVDRMARNGWGELHLRCVDKEFAKDAALKLMPNIRVARTVDVIPMLRSLSFEAFVDQLKPYIGQRLVAKPTHGSAATEFLDQNPNLMKLYRTGRYNYFYSFRESQYASLAHKIIVEENLSKDGRDLRDFKFFCAAGEILFVQVDAERFIEHKRILLAPPDFEPMQIGLGDFKRATEWDRPACFDRLCDAARALSKPFDFVRVDLYERDGDVFLGEFTFTPGAGMEPFSDPAFSRQLLKRINSLRSKSISHCSSDID